MEVRAVSKYLRISSQKTRLVADMVRGKKVDEALILLRYTPKKSSRLISKVLHSAMANAENTKSADLEKLYVKTIFVDQGPSLKRFRPRAMGRATKILKPSCHITVILSEK
jgi:large subunit ribosomal protein L22